jgi:hypothetical protein
MAMIKYQASSMTDSGITSESLTAWSLVWIIARILLHIEIWVHGHLLKDTLTLMLLRLLRITLLLNGIIRSSIERML